LSFHVVGQFVNRSSLLFNERGVSLMQKAIPTIAEKLNVSRYTIYNYLKILEGENINN